MRRGLTSLLAVAGIALAGCSTPSQPQVTFYSHGDSVRVSPVSYCNARGAECTKPRPDAVEGLDMPASAPLQISVPEEVSKAPWQVVFRYRTADGRELEGRGPVFAPGRQHAYKLDLPVPGARLTRVEVQRYAASLTVTPEGDVRFDIGGSWAVRDQPDDALN